MNLHKRVICALTGLVCVTLLTSCTPHSDGTHPVTITDAGNTSDLVSPPFKMPPAGRSRFLKRQPRHAPSAQGQAELQPTSKPTTSNQKILPPRPRFPGTLWFL